MIKPFYTVVHIPYIPYLIFFGVCVIELKGRGFERMIMPRGFAEPRHTLE